MAITRTARGTASSKTSGATLTISSVTVPQGHSLVVGLAYENGQLAPSSVTHAGKHLQRRVQQDNATRAIHNSMWLKGEYRLEQIGDIVATWDAAILERSMFATSYDLIQKRDGVSGREETTSTGTPATGSTGSLITAGSFVVELEPHVDERGSFARTFCVEVWHRMMMKNAST